MNETIQIGFHQRGLHRELDSLDDAGIDALSFGVIGFDRSFVVTRYNAYESRLAGLSRTQVLGMPLFTTVAPCMNNFLVCQQFEDAQAAYSVLDTTLNYVLTLRMRPTNVLLRLLQSPYSDHGYVLIERHAE